MVMVDASLLSSRRRSRDAYAARFDPFRPEVLRALFRRRTGGIGAFLPTYGVKVITALDEAEDPEHYDKTEQQFVTHHSPRPPNTPLSPSRQRKKAS